MQCSDNRTTIFRMCFIRRTKRQSVSAVGNDRFCSSRVLQRAAAWAWSLSNDSGIHLTSLSSVCLPSTATPPFVFCLPVCVKVAQLILQLGDWHNGNVLISPYRQPCFAESRRDIGHKWLCDALTLFGEFPQDTF